MLKYFNIFKNPYFLILLAGLFLDQLTKNLAQKFLSLFYPLWIIKPYFSLQLVHNYGAAYGILQNKRILLLVVSIAVICAALYFFVKYANNKLLKLGITFLCIGAIGNFLNRLFLGYVVDFVDIKIFPVFNLADVFIDLAILLLILDFFNLNQKQG
ncbi:MAG: signal peptidase II [Candidatus Margulisiibacteriota bacterium]